MTVPHRKALQPRFQMALAANTRAPSHKIASFLLAYIEGDDTLSSLMDAGDVTKQTAIRWRSKLQEIEESYLDSLDSFSTSDVQGDDPVERAKKDPTSRDYILTSLGNALLQAEEAKKPDMVARIARQISDIQGFKAKEMGRQYDKTQALGDEGLEAVDKEFALRIHAVGENMKFFPLTVEAILQFEALYVNEDGTSKLNSPKSRPLTANADFDAISPSPITDQISTSLAARTNPTPNPSSSSDSPDDDSLSVDNDSPDDTAIIHSIDDVMEDLTGE